MLLRTKLCQPPVRPFLVPRPHLIDKLMTGARGKLTLVAAPAGFGKTTLLAAWRQQAKDAAFCWLALDENDNDLARFMTYVVAALQTVAPDIGEPVLEMLPSPRPPSVDALMTALINEVAEIDPPIVLVLDDYHLIKNERIHEALAFLLEYAPPSLHICLVSRADPPLPLARWRARGQLRELRQDDLRFTAEETAVFLNQVMGLQLSGEDAAALNGRTEGWIAGLQLAAVSLQDSADPAAFIRSFTGSNRYVLDYLIEEVLQQQPAHIQEFLLGTAVLKQLSAPLCDAVLGRGAEEEGRKGDDSFSPAPQIPGSLATLDHLDRANLFVVPLDDQRQWYRYHRLFADLLQQRLQQTHPEWIPERHQRASHWFQAQNMMTPAIDHALAAADFARAADLVTQTAEAKLRQSEVDTLMNWVKALPEVCVQQRPELSLYYGWACLLHGAPLAQIEPFLPQLEDEAAPDGKTALFQAFMAVFRGQLEQAQTLLHRALAALPSDDHYWRSLAAWIMSISTPDILTADFVDEPSLAEAVKLGQASENVMVTVAAMCNQAETRRRRGQLAAAQALYEEALALAKDKRGRPLPIAGEALMGLGDLALERNDLAAAENYLRQGIEQTRHWREIAAFTGYLSLARVRQAQGDGDGVDVMLHAARQLAVRFDATELDDLIVAVYQARLDVMRGRMDTAVSWAESRRLLPERAAPPPSDMGELYESTLRKYEELVLVRIWLAQEKYAAALALLDELLPQFEEWQRIRLIIEALLLRVQCFLGQANEAAALRTLEQALVQGEPGGYRRVFLDEGEPIRHLLPKVKLIDRALPAYREKLLAVFGETMPQLPTTSSQPLVEPLSEREMEVLQLIAAGLSNREIGLRLSLSLATVKWHSSNIYGKLGVGNRVTAVATAQQLGILTSEGPS